MTRQLEGAPAPPQLSSTDAAPNRAALARYLARQATKRVFDVSVATLAIVILSPALIAIAIAIKFDSAGPVFYRVRRVGYRGRPLLMLKFRKMTQDASGGPLTIADDPRLTRVGRVLTSTRLDELPQLWDVLRGRMSIIGPRPEDPGFVALHGTEYSEILTVRPGITGLSQIAYKEEATIVSSSSPVEDYIERILPQKLKLDGLYARSFSLPLDLRVCFWTFVTVALRHPVSVSRVDAAMRLRRRPATSALSPLPVDVDAAVGSGLGVGLVTTSVATPTSVAQIEL